MRNSTVFYWQFEKQQILCLPSHQNGERQHWKSPLQCLSEPWPWECASTTGKGATCGQQGPPFLSPECQMFDSWCCGGIPYLSVCSHEVCPALERRVWTEPAWALCTPTGLGRAGNLRAPVCTHNWNTRGCILIYNVQRRTIFITINTYTENTSQLTLLQHHYSVLITSWISLLYSKPHFFFFFFCLCLLQKSPLRAK